MCQSSNAVINISRQAYTFGEGECFGQIIGSDRAFNDFIILVALSCNVIQVHAAGHSDVQNL